VPEPDEWAIVYVDGASRGNPGPAGIGIVIKIGNDVEKHREYVGRQTNNRAEYIALVKALEKVLSKNIRKVRVYTDSQLLAKQVSGEYRVRSRSLSELHNIVAKLRSALEEFEIKYVDRVFNAEADRLANQAIDEATR